METHLLCRSVGRLLGVVWQKSVRNTKRTEPAEREDMALGTREDVHFIIQARLRTPLAGRPLARWVRWSVSRDCNMPSLHCGSSTQDALSRPACARGRRRGVPQAPMPTTKAPNIQYGMACAPCRVSCGLTPFRVNEGVSRT